MVAVGSLIREDCSVKSKARMGTIVKTTRLILSNDSRWKEELERWVGYATANGNQEPDMTMCLLVRPGTVANVRWQHDPNKVTVHVFYDDCKGQANINCGTNTIEVVGGAP